MLSLPWGLQLAGEAGDGVSLPRLCIVCLLSLAWRYSTGKSSPSQPTRMLLTPWNVGIQLSRIPCLPVGSTARTTSTTLPHPSSSSWSSLWSTSGMISFVVHIPSWILGKCFGFLVPPSAPPFLFSLNSHSTLCQWICQRHSSACQALLHHLPHCDGDHHCQVCFLG